MPPVRVDAIVLYSSVIKRKQKDTKRNTTSLSLSAYSLDPASKYNPPSMFHPPTASKYSLYISPYLTLQILLVVPIDVP
jgi:hypothetical protein